VAEEGLTSGVAVMVDKTIGTIVSLGILAVIGWGLLPSAGMLFLVLFVFAAGVAVLNRIKGR